MAESALVGELQPAPSSRSSAQLGDEMESASERERTQSEDVPAPSALGYSQSTSTPSKPYLVANARRSLASLVREEEEAAREEKYCEPVQPPTVKMGITLSARRI